MSDWGEFDFSERVEVRARSEDPGTSHEAAAILTANQAKIGHSIAVVIQLLEKHGVMSDFDIRDFWSEACGEEASSEGLPRMARLWAQRKGLIEHAGFTKHENRRCRTWKLL